MNAPRPALAAPATSAATEAHVPSTEHQISWADHVPLLATHAMCLAAFWTGASARDLLVCAALFYVRMFGVSAGYHRYFSHRAFKTSRAFQLVLAILACSSAQRGVLWWAGHHRHHHRASDQPDDIHSPRHRGFVWAHFGWLLSKRHEETNLRAVRDFARYPELRFLDRHYLLVPGALALVLYLAGGASLLVWGFFISTVLVWHSAFTINSIHHMFGSRRYETSDDSRNNWFLAIFVTCGEGWHNNHHHRPHTASFGRAWWEIDVTYRVLQVLSLTGLVWDLREHRPET
jgi:stearoyl-CoA desaturase (delta-9 desaturase)